MSNNLNITVDQVNHPLHYTTDPSGVECIQITRHRNFYIKDEINRLEGKYHVN